MPQPQPANIKLAGLLFQHVDRGIASPLPVVFTCPLSTPQVVAPKRAALAEANRKLEGANKKLSGIRAKVKELQDRVALLEAGLMKATEDKNHAIAQVGVGG